MPFRAIVSERDTWQNDVLRYLQSNLETLSIPDSFRVSNSEAVEQFLSTDSSSKCSTFSIDIEDLYYSIPQGELIASIQSCIAQDNDELSFSLKCGTSVSSFLELLSFYLKSPFVAWGGNLHVQRSGTCIGSSVAPILSEILLGKIDVALQRHLSGVPDYVFTYVDDFLVFTTSSDFTRDVVNISKVFKETGKKLNLSLELPHLK